MAMQLLASRRQSVKTGHETWGPLAVSMFRNRDKVGLRSCRRPRRRIPTTLALDSWAWQTCVLPGKMKHGELTSASRRKKEEQGTHFIWLLAQGAPFTILCTKLKAGPRLSHMSAVQSRHLYLASTASRLAEDPGLWQCPLPGSLCF